MSVKTFQDWVPAPVCELCKRQVPLEKHHKQFRSQLGSDEPENLIAICRVCHGAAHGLRVVDNGFSCQKCHILARYGCYFGERVLGLPSETPAPWGKSL